MDPGILSMIEQRGILGITLRLGACNITDEYALPISKAASKGQLRDIELYGNRITNDGCDAIVAIYMNSTYIIMI